MAAAVVAILDPGLVVLGGGVGIARRLYRESGSSGWSGSSSPTAARSASAK
jgi:hypothetical protein